MAEAAREVAAKNRARDPEFSDDKLIEKWEEAAYLRLGQGLKGWNSSASGKSFFEYSKELFADNSKLAGANAANLLDSLADILDGK